MIGLVHFKSILARWTTECVASDGAQDYGDHDANNVEPPDVREWGLQSKSKESQENWERTADCAPNDSSYGTDFLVVPGQWRGRRLRKDEPRVVPQEVADWALCPRQRREYGECRHERPPHRRRTREPKPVVFPVPSDSRLHGRPHCRRLAIDHRGLISLPMGAVVKPNLSRTITARSVPWDPKIGNAGNISTSVCDGAPRWSRAVELLPHAWCVASGKRPLPACTEVCPRIPRYTATYRGGSTAVDRGNAVYATRDRMTVGVTSAAPLSGPSPRRNSTLYDASRIPGQRVRFHGHARINRQSPPGDEGA